MLGGADNPNGELQSYIIGANTRIANTSLVPSFIRNSQSEFRVSQVNINSVKQTINMHKTMGWFGIFMAFFSLHLSRQEATLCVTSIQGPRVN